jgi:hypothetical protein
MMTLKKLGIDLLFIHFFSYFFIYLFLRIDLSQLPPAFHNLTPPQQQMYLDRLKQYVFEERRRQREQTQGEKQPNKQINK